MRNSYPIIVDLFCGAGGLSLGAARAGFAIRGAVDIDPQAMRAHGKNFRDTSHLLANVSQLTGDSLLSSLGIQDRELSGIIGGPPCQGFSNMGRRNGEDPRNLLFVDFFRVVSEVRPSFYLAENVPGIMRPANSSLVDEALSWVSGSYVMLPPFRISAQCYGAPTARTRVFFFGYLPNLIDGFTEDSFLPPADIETVRVGDALEGLPDEVNPFWQKESEGWQISTCRGEGYFSSRLHGHLPGGVGDPEALYRLETECRSSGNLGTVHSPRVAERYGALKPGERDQVSRSQRLDLDGFCPTLRAGTGPEKGSYQAVRPIHPSFPRVITPREAARLQGFPDWFIFSPSKWHSFRQIGSSVSPIVSERLMSVIRESFKS